MPPRLRSLLLFVLLASCHADRVDAAPKPCGGYFTAGRNPGPVGWLSGVWVGNASANGGAPQYLELVWSPLTGGTMTGMARSFAITQHAPDRTLGVDFFIIRQEPDGKLVYLEQAGAPTPLVFALVEGRDGFAAFERKDGKDTIRVSLKLSKDGAGKLDLRRERPGDVREWRLWRDL